MAVPPSPPLTDDEIDSLLPESLWALARVHFTPVDVARLAAHLLAPVAGDRVLDVGAGVGKFCIAAALAHPEVTFVGVERRPALVELARSLAYRLGAANVEIIHGDAFELDWADYTGFYLFNPWGEHAHGGAPSLDDDGGRDAARFFRSVRTARERLALVPTGTRVVTYFGLGNRPPPGFEVTEIQHPTGRVERWVRR